MSIMDFIYYIILGAGVGLAIGLTGVGGGSLMTPLLIFSGIPPNIAIGTDLLYAAITKTGGVISHHQQKSIHWDLVCLLAAGSIPASILTSYMLHQMSHFDYAPMLSKALGLMLIASAGMIFYKRMVQTPDGEVHISEDNWVHRHSKPITFIAGLFLGVVVTLSSVGAGAFCAVLLLSLYPRLPALNIVGTDIAHAVPLTLIGGLGHFFLLGNIDFYLLGGLLVGSLPAVYLGTQAAKKIPNSVLQPILASILLVIGFKFCFIS